MADDARKVSLNVFSRLAFAVGYSLSAAEPALPPAIPFLGEAPTAPVVGTERFARQLASPGESTGFQVDVVSREEVRSFHNTVYLSSERISSGWTGRYDGCEPGTTTEAFKDAVLRRINYFRAMAGVPAGVGRSEVFSTKAQQAALIMSAEGDLSHYPPPGWACYTVEGHEAAGNSNLAWGSEGAEAIDGYMEDYGQGNAAVGHRRWLLYPQTRTMGTGDVPGEGSVRAANATWVFDGNFGKPRPVTREPYVAWPPPGYVPYTQVYTRWSFGHPDADFGSATVTLSSNGVPVAVRLESLSTGIGEPTLAWYAVGANPNVPVPLPKPLQDIDYSVEIRGVRLQGATVNFAYHVQAFDPAVPGPDHVKPVIAGSMQVPVGVPSSYTFTAVPQAEGYQWRQATRETGTVVEGAESNLAGFMDQTSGGYDLAVRSPVASGSFSFHLAHPSPVRMQALVYEKGFLAGPTSELRFKSRLGWASARQRAVVHVSLDEGRSWTEVYGQSGTDGAGEPAFNSRVVGLGAFAGRTLQFRFGYDYAGTGTYFPQTAGGVGWYLDDIEFGNLERLGTMGSPVSVTVPAFRFQPAAAGSYLLQARALVFGGFALDWGPAHSVSASGTAPPTLTWSAPRMSGTQLILDFRVTGGTSPTRYELLRAAGGAWDWAPVAGAEAQVVVPEREFRFTVEAGPGSSGFYRVRGF